MKIKNIDVTKTIEEAKLLLKEDSSISRTTKATLEALVMLVSSLINRITLNSSNSSKPSSTDQQKTRRTNKDTKKKPGGQVGHNGSTLTRVSNPDEIKNINIDRTKLSKEKTYRSKGYESRQVINVKISTYVTEYRAEILVDEDGKKYIAPFPETVTRAIQYGASIKAIATYNSVYQLIPYERTQEQFKNEYKIPISTGSICNFKEEASNLIVKLGVEKIIKQELQKSSLAHVDETSINLNGTKFWLHNMSNEKWTWFAAHMKRGSEAMNDIAIIPSFSGILCHDHWKPYYSYKCTHSLCNAHHLRELTRAFEQDKQIWASKMHDFLVELNKEVNRTDAQKLPKEISDERIKQYRQILAEGNQGCPEILPKPGTKRKPAQSQARNLLSRLRDYENDVLRFMVDSITPFTNNLGERDIRMIKVQQKISGCFRSIDTANHFCRVRAYLSTCKKNGVSASDALEMLFNRKLPEFLQKILDST